MMIGSINTVKLLMIKINENLQPDTIDETDENIIDSEELNQNELHEDGAETIAGVIHTMFTVTDFLEDDERQNILNIAPGEGNRALKCF